MSKRAARSAPCSCMRENSCRSREFDQCWPAAFPNAEITSCEAVKQQGVVTRPLDDISDYEDIAGQPAASATPLASQYLAPAV